MTSVRRIISDLPPKALEDLGLFGALRLMAKNFEKRHDVRCHVCLPGYEPHMPQKAASAIYRMVQESLTNVAKHACATDVEIAMEILDNRVLLSVADNGKGFSAQALQKAGSFGLIGMRERAGALNGGLKVESAIGSGTTIYVTLPLDDTRHCGAGSDTPVMPAQSA
ncbi:MAG: sensor histidine kinase, partial [Bacillota bacterium]